MAPHASPSSSEKRKRSAAAAKRSTASAMPVFDSGSLSKMVAEVGSLVGQYRWMSMSLGTANDGPHLRKELCSLRSSALKACDSASNAVLPQLRAEAAEGSADFTKQASQFIACLTMFQAELRRTHSLVSHFPLGKLPAPAHGHASAPDPEADQQLLTGLARDQEEVEGMLTGLENLMTVHFSTKDSEVEPLQPPRPRRKGCNLASLCSSLKTNYA